jgi:glycosyltransferase involved in cell wall biosynthesis
MIAGSTRFLAPRPPAGPTDRGKPPMFSVIIAAYQGAATIGEAVCSALCQTYSPEEVIVCDDGSTDDLEGALAPYRDRISLLRQSNAGQASALNKAAGIARGDFLAILDQDDVFLPGRLAALAALATERPDLDLITTDEYLEVGGRIVGRHLEHIDFPIHDQRTAILRTGFLGHPAVRRDRFIAAGGFDESFRFAADVECWTRLILAGAQVGMVDEPLMRYRLHVGAVTANRTAALRDRVRTLEKHAANPHLRLEERQVLERTLLYGRRRAMLAESEAAIRGLIPAARTRLMAIVRDNSFTREERVRAVAALLAPRVARRWIERRERRTGFSYLERPMDRLARATRK